MASTCSCSRRRYGGACSRERLFANAVLRAVPGAQEGDAERERRAVHEARRDRRHDPHRGVLDHGRRVDGAALPRAPLSHVELSVHGAARVPPGKAEAPSLRAGTAAVAVFVLQIVVFIVLVKRYQYTQFLIARVEAGRLLTDESGKELKELDYV